MARGGSVRYFCNTCPYLYLVDRRISKQVPIERKQVDDVLGGEDEWKNVAKTAASCPKCHHSEAFFMSIQIRSADEPSTL